MTSLYLHAVRIGFLLLLLLPPAHLRAQLFFSQPALYPAGNTPSAITKGDFNRDGSTDIAVTNKSQF